MYQLAPNLPFEISTSTEFYSAYIIRIESFGFNADAMEILGTENSGVFRATFRYTWCFDEHTTIYSNHIEDSLIRVWTVHKTETALFIHCNDELAFNVTYDEGSHHCGRVWNREDFTWQLRFGGRDYESDYYRRKPTKGSMTTHSQSLSLNTLSNNKLVTFQTALCPMIPLVT